VAAPGYPLRLPTRLPVLWRVMAVAAPSVVMLYLAFPARAGSAGLKLFDAWGFPRRVGWAEVHEVRLSRWAYLLWAPSLRVQLHDGRVRWLPRETRGLAELHALALREGGPAHPLVAALQTPLHQL
jgi:hypothetical protein